ncbi:MAG: 4Fe-4S binding protein, partial [Anaerolineae bacterium]|nr:4Fe-4S binding protein [Anaerolineae bacterium]
YCRATKRLVGEDCGHPLETCFYFNELGMVKLEANYGRRIDVAEALSILRGCEEAGLVHNVSNCEGKIQTLCNCCACSCAVMKAVVRGQTNVGAPSRYRSALLEERCTLCGACIDRCPVRAISAGAQRLSLDTQRCIGCGQCVSRCPEQALHMVLREHPPKIYADNDALFRRINVEAMLGLASRKLLGR